MFVLTIKTCFFNGVDSYNLGRKLYTLRFFSLFCEEMIIVIYAMLVIVIGKLFLMDQGTLGGSDPLIP